MSQIPAGVKKGIPLMSNKGALTSARHFGLNREQATKELIDNAIDGQATVVHVHIFPEGKSDSMVIEDDGVGIDPARHDEVLAFGGRIERAVRGIGRFAFGLPSAICSQTTRGELYSHQEGGPWMESHIDLDELAAMPGEPIIPKPRPLSPPEHLPLQLRHAPSGTVVYLRECDRETPDNLRDYANSLMSELGRTYRYYLSGGRLSIYVNGQPVQPVDPLFMLEDCMYKDQAGTTRVLTEIVEIPEVVDPETGVPARVTMRFGCLDYRTIVKNALASKKPRKFKKALGIDQESQGFSIVRGMREIDYAQTLNLFTRHNRLNYAHFEVAFPPALDDLFGVQTVKSRFHLDKSMRSRLKNAFNRQWAAIEQHARDAMAFDAAEQPEEPGPRESEVIAQKVESILKPTPLTRLTPEKREEAKAHREQKKQETIKAILASPDLSENQKQAKVKEVAAKYDFQGHVIISVKSLGSANFYEPRFNVDHVEVVINTDHPFFTKMYQPAAESGLATPLELLLITLARGETMYLGTQTQVFYQNARSDWTNMLRTYYHEPTKTPEGPQKLPRQEVNEKVAEET